MALILKTNYVMELLPLFVDSRSTLIWPTLAFIWALKFFGSCPKLQRHVYTLTPWERRIQR